jgi:methionyl aminopeptidase
LIRIKSPREIDLMRRSGRALAGVFVETAALMKPDAVTGEIDIHVEDAIRSRGAKPAFKGYRGGAKRSFPASSCISIDSEVVHGIPSRRKLLTGQLVGLDSGLAIDGWFADMAASFQIGPVSDVKKRLWKVTREALYIGIAQARKGNRISDIGAAVQDYVEKNGFAIIRDLVGHGIGTSLHEDPPVPNYRSKEGSTPLRAGMTIAIEPMVSAGDYRIKTLSDGWTAVTWDASPTCHFEHTVVITDGEPEILTLLPDGQDPWRLIWNLTEEANA